MDKGWISRNFCYVHDSPPITEEDEQVLEDNEWDMDCICIPTVRITWGEDGPLTGGRERP